MISHTSVFNPKLKQRIPLDAYSKEDLDTLEQCADEFLEQEKEQIQQLLCIVE